MRGSSDQTAMNNKHIKRFHFSISPPRSIRSGAAERSSDQIIAFQNRHLQLSSAWSVAICSSVIVRPSPSSSYFPRRRRFDGKMSAVGFFFLQILSFVISPSALFLQQCSGESPFQSDNRSTCSRFNPPSLPTSSIFALTNYLGITVGTPLNGAKS